MRKSFLFNKYILFVLFVCVLGSSVLWPGLTKTVFAECKRSEKAKITVHFTSDGTAIEKIDGHVAYYDDAFAGKVGTYCSDRAYNFVFTTRSPQNFDTKYCGGVTRWDFLDPGNMKYANSSPQSFVTTEITESGYFGTKNYGLIEADIIFDSVSGLAGMDPNTTYYGLLVASNGGGMYYTDTYVTVTLSQVDSFRYAANFNYNGHGGNDFTLPVKKNNSVNSAATHDNEDYEKWNDVQKYAVDNWATVVGAPSAAGYRFGGWYTNPELTQAADFSKIITDNTTFYAKWNVPVTGVTLSKSSTEMKIDGTETLSANVSPDNASDKSVTWSSDNEAVATVDSTGLITAKAYGTAKITAKTTDGEYTAACDVTVNKKQRSNVEVLMPGYAYGTTSIPSPSLAPAQADEPPTTYYYNIVNSKSDCKEWKDMTSTSLNAGTYYMYAKVVETDVYQEYKTELTSFVIQPAECDVIPPTGEYEYGEKLSDKALVGGSASFSGTDIEGSFEWAASDRDIVPNVSDSNSKEFNVVFTPDDSNYSPKNCKALIEVTPMDAKDVTAVVTIDENALTASEKLTDKKGNVLIAGQDYIKGNVTSTTIQDTTVYEISFDLKENYKGSITKAIKVTKPKKQPGDNEDDNIITVVESEKSAEYKPAAKAVPDRNVKSVIAQNVDEKETEIASQLEDSSSSLTVDDIKNQLESNNPTITVESDLIIEIKEQEEEKVESTDKQLIEQAVSERGAEDNIGYLDINMYVKYSIIENNEKIIEMACEKVTDTENLGAGKGFESTITIQVPEEMRNKSSDIKRTFYLVRVHDNKLTELKKTTDTTITFDTGLFSTYALFYKDTKIPKGDPSPSDDTGSGSGSSNTNTATPAQIAPLPIIVANGFVSPKTGDSYEIFIWAGILIVGAGLVICAKRKKKENN